MREILKKLYWGDIRPWEQRISSGADLRRVCEKCERCEQQLSEQLSETGKTLLTELVNAQQRINSITAQDYFILGFQLAVQMMAECMDSGDGDRKEMAKHG